MLITMVMMMMTMMMMMVIVTCVVNRINQLLVDGVGDGGKVE